MFMNSQFPSFTQYGFRAFQSFEAETFLLSHPLVKFLLGLEGTANFKVLRRALAFVVGFFPPLVKKHLFMIFSFEGHF